MFRKFADRVSNAANNAADRVGNAIGGLGAGAGQAGGGGSSTSGLQQLMSMGFSESDSRHALQLFNNNVEQAADWLLNNRHPVGVAGTTTTSHPSPGMQATAQQIEDDDLQKALAASLEQQNNQAATNTVRSAASKRAGQAALSRFEQKKTNTTNTKKKAVPATTNKPREKSPVPAQQQPSGPMYPAAIANPNLTKNLPKEMSKLEKEEQIMRCANRMAPYPKAVDTVLKSLKQLQQNPNNAKFKTLDTNSTIFQKSLNAPGVIDFFKAMNYHPSPSNLNVLHLSFVDPATIYLGISALEQIQLTDIYLVNKAKQSFDLEIQQLLDPKNTVTSNEETLKRADFLKKCPSEPTQGGSLIQVQIGLTTNKITRKFDGDDTLEDVLNWITGSTHSMVYDRLTKHEWYLVNMNQNAALNIKTGLSKTLQALGCWPSGRLQIVGTLPEYSTKNTSSRGLGAAGIASDYL